MCRITIGGRFSAIKQEILDRNIFIFFYRDTFTLFYRNIFTLFCRKIFIFIIGIFLYHSIGISLYHSIGIFLYHSIGISLYHILGTSFSINFQYLRGGSLTISFIAEGEPPWIYEIKSKLSHARV